MVWTRFRRGLPRSVGGRLALAGLVVGLLLVTAGGAVAATSRAPGFTVTDELLSLRSGPSGDEPVQIDVSWYLPAGASAAEPVPAVMLAHGFGGSKESVAADAEDFAERGYAVLTWTARGFGRSGGQVHLNHPDYEVRDAQRLLDWLAQRPEVRTDAAGDPRVGVVGGSYGGALALMLAAADPRVDAIVPMITWHDLADAFLPEASGAGPAAGVFKQSWAGVFFGGGAGLLGGAGPAAPPDLAGLARPGACGPFAADLCAAYVRVATAGEPDEAAVARLRESSPAGSLGRITAPTLLIQGGGDSLFPLSEADANAAGIAAAGTPVRVAWFTGGHDGGSGPQSDQDRVRYLTAQWLDHYLADTGPEPDRSFTWSRISGLNVRERGVVTTGYTAEAYPGLSGVTATEVAVTGGAQAVVNPPGGSPAAISALPAAGELTGLLDGVAAELPGQHARFDSAPLAAPLEVVGAPTVALQVTSPAPGAVLFAKLYDVDPGGVATLVGNQVAPLRLAEPGGEPVAVTLPAVTHRFESGHRVRIVVATTDQAYATPAEPAAHLVDVAGPVSLPSVPGEPIASPAVIWRWVLAGLVAALALGLAGAVGVARYRRRRSVAAQDPAGADLPLAVRGLRKEYPGGFVAVARIDLTVERNQVVGLLGPNGAGKTTALRVLLGLSRPSAGEVRVFGHRLGPGAPVLSRVGALVEGPGFLPHLSGYDNLTAYWRATGRPAADAHLPEAVEIAGLGDSIHRKVRTYSHGMRQRLAIAQAMLGLPELLILDEPTDGLDPPQIAQMRRVLRRYATEGRAVLVSSHLLAEVEQTCSHVVVVHKGRVVAAGAVAEVVGDSPTVGLDVTEPERAADVLGRVAGIREVTRTGDRGLVVDTNGVPRSEVVAALVAAGVGVDRVVPRRRLEDAFLALVGEDTKGSGDR